jgi:hypothetical protein
VSDDKPKIGELLVAEGLIDEFQLTAALREQNQWGRRLGETLVRMEFVAESALVQVLCRALGCPGVSLTGKTIEQEVLDLVPTEVAEKNRCLPLFRSREAGHEILHVGMDNPDDLAVIDELSFRTGLRVRPVVVGPVQLGDALRRFYGGMNESLAVPPAVPIPEAEVHAGDTAPDLGGLPQTGRPGEIVLDEEMDAPPGLPAPPVAPPAVAGPAPVAAPTAELPATPVAPVPEPELPAPGPVTSAGAGPAPVAAAAAEVSPAPVAAAAAEVSPAPVAAAAAEAEMIAPVPPPVIAPAAPVARPEAATLETRETPLAGEPAPAADSKPSQVPTRQLLQAVTKLLLQKGLITREEFMAKIWELGAGPDTED